LFLALAQPFQHKYMSNPNRRILCVQIQTVNVTLATVKTASQVAKSAVVNE